MDVYIHCLSRTGAERFVVLVSQKNERTVAMLQRLLYTPSATFTPNGGKGKFRLWHVEKCEGDLHFFALRAVDLH